MDPDRIAMPPPQSPITTWVKTIELNNHLFLWKTHLSSNCIYHHQPGRPDKPDSGGGEGAGNLLALKMKLTWKFLPLVSVPMIIHYGCDGDKVDDDDDIERMNMMWRRIGLMFILCMQPKSGATVCIIHCNCRINILSLSHLVIPFNLSTSYIFTFLTTRPWPWFWYWQPRFPGKIGLREASAAWRRTEKRLEGSSRSLVRDWGLWWCW